MSAALLAGLAGAAGFLGAAELGADLVGRVGGQVRNPWRGSAVRIRGLILNRLIAARRPADLGLRGWLAVKAVCALFGEVGVLLLSGGLPGRATLLLIVAAPVAGFLGPDGWLARISRRRTEAAVRDLPDMLDLFRVTVGAGMPPARALGVVAREFDGPLAAEWKRLSAEVELGIAQDEALAGLAQRLPAGEIASFVDSLTRGRRHGAPLGELLAVQASRARNRRAERIREQAARAGPKIQLVVALLLVPAVLLLVAAGLVAELERSGLLLPR